MEYTRASHARRGSGASPARGDRPAPTTVPFDPRAAWISPLGLIQLQQTAGNTAAHAAVQRVTEGPGVEVTPGEPQIVGPEGAQAAPGRTTAPGAQAAPADGASTASRTLRYGDTGDDVKLLQMKLRRLAERTHDRPPGGYSRIDGIFGPLTRQDVIDFQVDAGLDADGVVGPRTWNAIHSLVPGRPTEEGERASDARFSEAAALYQDGQYEAALTIIDDLTAQSMTPEDEALYFGCAGECHHQRGRFGVAVTMYRRALAGRYNQETQRAAILANLAKAQDNQYLNSATADPEWLPTGGVDQPRPERYEGGGITQRTPVHSGDTGAVADLFKGKLAHAMSSWLPGVSAGDQIDADTVTTIRQFQRACGLSQTGDGDATTWHALDQYSPRDIPNSVHARFGERREATQNVERLDLPASIPLWESLVNDTREAGLIENSKYLEFRLGRAHHRLSHFEEALTHYEAYLNRVIPDPSLLKYVFESIRLARERQPAP